MESTACFINCEQAFALIVSPLIRNLIKLKDLFRLCPPSTACSPQVKSTCHYIISRYVKAWHLRLRGANNMHQEIWVLARPNRPKYGYSERTDRNMDTLQTEIWVLPKQNRPKYGNWQDRTDQNMGIDQTDQTKIAIDQTKGVTQIFSRPLGWVAPDPPVRNPGRSGQCQSWVADFIRGWGHKRKDSKSACIEIY